MDGDVKGSRELQLRALPLIEKLFCEVNPIPVKAAMNMLGWEAVSYTHLSRHSGTAETQICG